MSDGGQESVNDEEEEDYSEDQSNPDSLVITEEDNGEGGDQAGGDFKNARGKSKPYKKNKDRITSSFLTKYERARVLGTRAL